MLRGWVALTGTPGVGKSAVADRLRLGGIPNVDVGRFAHDNELTVGFDEQRLSALIDPARVGRELAAVTQRGALLLLDGHWSHEVPGVRHAIVLRLRPASLEARLLRRGWPPAKVRENLEAEAIDLLLQEAVAGLGRAHVSEIDTTGRSVEAVARDVAKLVRGDRARRARFAPGRVDWAADILAWYGGEAVRNS